jgi:MerR family transcriptional regulator, redox-sensitive transcriptional activator SoxR
MAKAKPKATPKSRGLSKATARLTIGEVSTETGLAGSALRYYEREGLIPKAPKEDGRRVYEADILDWLAVIDLAKRTGMTIAETKGLIDPLGRARAAAQTWQKFAIDKIEEIDERIECLEQMKRVLRALTSCECPTLEDCGRAMHDSDSC